MFDPNKYIGKPYLAKGRTPQGFDCWGLVLWILDKEYGVNLIDRHVVDCDDLRSVLRAFKRGRFFWNKLDSPRDGCVVGMSKNVNNDLHHAGIMVSGGCLHAVKGSGVVFNKLNVLKWYQYPKIEFYTWQ